MAMTAFLPSGPGVRTSVLEIFPRRMTRQRTHAWFDYKRWAVMNSVSYHMLDRQRDTEGPDGCEDKDFRLCGNMTVDIGAVTSRLRSMLANARAPAEAAGPTAADAAASEATAAEPEGSVAAAAGATEGSGGRGLGVDITTHAQTAHLD